MLNGIDVERWLVLQRVCIICLKRKKYQTQYSQQKEILKQNISNKRLYIRAYGGSSCTLIDYTLVAVPMPSVVTNFIVKARQFVKIHFT